MKPIKIFLVDDHFIVRMGLAASLNEESDLNVVGEASCIAEAIDTLPETTPDVAVIDLRLADGDGFELVARLAEDHPGVRCLILSVNTGENDILQSFKAGACGYLSKSVERAELLEAIRSIADGDTYFPAHLRSILDKGIARPELTAREFGVLQLIVEGHLNKEIADQLNLAEITVKQHVSAILRKLGVQDRTQAAIAAVERGLIHLKK